VWEETGPARRTARIEGARAPGRPPCVLCCRTSTADACWRTCLLYKREPRPWDAGTSLDTLEDPVAGLPGRGGHPAAVRTRAAVLGDDR